MSGKTVFARLSTGLFIAAEAVIYVLFMYLDITGGPAGTSTTLKFAGISLCLITALADAAVARAAKPTFLAAAMFFTVLADSCLLGIADGLPYEFGVICFCFTQLMYMILQERIRFGVRSHIRGFNPVLYYVLRIGAATGAAAATLLLPEDIVGDDALLVAVTAFYGTCFVINIATSIATAVRVRTMYDFRTGLFAAGLVVFALCDLNVLLYNLPEYLEINSQALLFLLRFAGDFMWMFYLPSQVMLVKSVKLTKKI